MIYTITSNYYNFSVFRFIAYSKVAYIHNRREKASTKRARSARHETRATGNDLPARNAATDRH